MTVVEKLWLTIVAAIPAVAMVLFVVDLLAGDSKREDFYLTKHFMVFVFVFLLMTLVGLFIMLIASIWGFDLSLVVPNLAKLAREMP